jgi:hypothetical protein
MAQVTRVQRAGGRVVGALILAVSLGGRASAPLSGPRRMEPDDLKWLAGQ